MKHIIGILFLTTILFQEILKKVLKHMIKTTLPKQGNSFKKHVICNYQIVVKLIEYSMRKAIGLSQGSIVSPEIRVIWEK